jgi:glycosyltransferase involved in cell wall biosynthesis
MIGFKMENPFFSVVIPTNNRSLLLKRAIEGVLNQTFTNFEVIVVDDNSTDDTARIVESFSDPRLRYMMNQRSKGACGARNTGIHAAKCKWVAFLDDDDLWLDDKLEKQYELINSSPKTVGLICTDYTILDEKKKKVVKNRPSGQEIEKLLSGGYIGCLSSVCVKLKILKQINGFDENFPSNQDFDLYIRVAQKTELASVPRALVYIYQENRKDRIGADFKKKLDGWVLLRDKHLESFEN